MANEVPHLERAVELLWESGHPKIGEALREEVEQLLAKCNRIEAIIYPRAVKSE